MHCHCECTEAICFFRETDFFDLVPVAQIESYGFISFAMTRYIILVHFPSQSIMGP